MVDGVAVVMIMGGQVGRAPSIPRLYHIRRLSSTLLLQFLDTNMSQDGKLLVLYTPSISEYLVRFDQLIGYPNNLCLIEFHVLLYLWVALSWAASVNINQYQFPQLFDFSMEEATVCPWSLSRRMLLYKR